MTIEEIKAHYPGKGCVCNANERAFCECGADWRIRDSLILDWVVMNMYRNNNCSMAELIEELQK